MTRIYSGDPAMRLDLVDDLVCVPRRGGAPPTPLGRKLCRVGTLLRVFPLDGPEAERARRNIGLFGAAREVLSR